MEEYSKMLLDSAKCVYNIIQKPVCSEENKLVIAGANTLAQTAKAAIQVEVLQNRAGYTVGHTSRIIHRVHK